MALKRLEERLEEWLDAQERKITPSGTDDTPLHRTPPALRGSHAKTRVNTKGPKGQRIKGSKGQAPHKPKCLIPNATN